MSYVSDAVRGSDDYHEVMRQAASVALQRMAGYIAPTADFTPPRQGFMFTVVKPAKNPLISLDIREHGTVFYPDEPIRLEIKEAEPNDTYVIRYRVIKVFGTFVMFQWHDADQIDFEWATLQISIRDLIEIQYEDTEQRRVWLTLMWNRVWDKWK